MTPAEMIATLQSFGGITRAHHVTTFSCTRQRANGGMHMVTVEIHDAGPNADPGSRFVCVARSDDGKAASGNSDSTIPNALAGVHWYELDK